MTDWLFDTLLWTAGLIALVLVLRRPVTKHFGPQIAYALWAIPAVRLVLPPLELPAWLNPAPVNVADPASTQAAAIPFIEVVQSEAPAATMSGLDAATGSVIPATPIPFLEIGISVWLTGAALFLILRFHSYFRLRAELLESAREVGRYGRIRMLETPGTKAPIAFGVLDPVIAMPPGFMAQQDRTMRDLALMHEFSHHNARDLLANVLVQPLFALHWFNPLGRYGWLAMRRDQEAACDARVMSATPADERGTYAAVIASFAAGPNFALAAPMACPVLGDKSIVHRLRSLKMSNTSVRRRYAGRFMVGAALIALPLTASITYAEEASSPKAPLGPLAPAAPLAVGAPAAPTPPAPPAPPALMQDIEAVDPGQSETNVEALEEDTEVREVRIERFESRAERAEERAERLQDRAEQRERRVVQIRRNIESGRNLDDEEINEIMIDVREGLAEADEALAEARIEIQQVRANMETPRTKISVKCSQDGQDTAKVVEDSDGGRTVYICQERIMAQALTGLKEARKAISKNREIRGQMRRDLLETLDEQIREWERSTKT